MEGAKGSWALGVNGKGKPWDYHDIQPLTFQEKFIHRFLGAYDVPRTVLESKTTKMKTQIMSTRISHPSNFRDILDRLLLAQ